MNLTAILVAALVVGAPATYVAYQTTTAPAIVPASDAAPEPAREAETHESVDDTGLAIGAPYPTCPLQCRFGYAFLATSAEAFEVPEGATSIDVVATWTATSPLTREMKVGLYREDAECGEGCWLGVDGAEGVERVAFTVEAPEPGMYRGSAHPTGPAYVAAFQEVQFEIRVNL